MLREELAIVGGGPAGLTLSLFVRNHDIVIFEEHRDVGKPKHCAGFVGLETFKIYSSLASDEILDKAFSVLTFHTSKGSFKISSSKPFIYRINRPFLEEKLLDRVLSNCVEVRFGTKVKPTPQPGGLIFSGRELRYKWIVASDGLCSYFRRKYLSSKTKFIYGLNTVYRQNNGVEDEVHIFYSDLTPGFFAWYATTQEGYGLVGYGSITYVDPMKIASLVERKIGVKLLDRVEAFGGLISYDIMLDKPLIGNVLLFGDSAHMVKPYTGGGLSIISRLAPVLGSSIDKNDLSLYMNMYGRIRRKVSLEHLITTILRNNKYWIPAYILHFVRNVLEVELNLIEIFDNHILLLTRTMPYLTLAVLDSLFGSFRSR